MIKSLRQKLPLTTANILMLYFFISAFGLIKISLFFSNIIYKNFLFESALKLLGHQALEHKIGKLGRLLEYGFGSLLFFIYLASIYFLLLKKLTTKKTDRSLLLSLLTGNVVLNFILLFSNKTSSLLIIIWVFLTFLVPFSLYFTPKKREHRPLRVFLRLCFGILSIQLLWIFIPLIFQPMLIENDFLDLPGKTLLSSNTWVDNTTFINAHSIGGLTKHDPRKPPSSNTLPSSLSFQVADVSYFENMEQYLSSSSSHHYIYDKEKQCFSLIGVMPEKDYTIFLRTLDNPKDLRSLTYLFLEAKKRQKTAFKRIYTAEEWGFYKKNKIELKNQSELGWFFYHHNYFLQPILATHLGSNDQPSVYGWLNAKLFSKALHLLGGINYHNYFKLFFSLYPIYYLLFALSLFIVFRSSKYALLGIMLTVSSLFLLDYQLIRLAPGFNPSRHFLDIIALTLLFLFFKQSNILYLLSSLFTATLAILVFKEFGLFLLAAICLATLIDQTEKKRLLCKVNLVVLLIATFGLSLYLLFPAGKFFSSKYMIMGIGAPVTHSKIVINLLLTVPFLYLFAWMNRLSVLPQKNYWLATLFYCQLLLIYFVWFPSFHHILAIGAPFILSILGLIFLSIRYFKLQHKELYLISMLCGLVAVFLYLPAGVIFYKNKIEYSANFKNHFIYDWKFERAKMKSTIDPSLFENAISLINKYAQAPKIYLISKYDVILPTLASKYSAFPFPEILTNLVNEEMILMIANQIREERPRYIFIDTNIDTDHRLNTFDPNDSIAQAYQIFFSSHVQATMLVKLKLIKDKINEEYTPIESSELITVYERK